MLKKNKKSSRVRKTRTKVLTRFIQGFLVVAVVISFTALGYYVWKDLLEPRMFAGNVASIVSEVSPEQLEENRLRMEAEYLATLSDDVKEPLGLADGTSNTSINTSEDEWVDMSHLPFEHPDDNISYDAYNVLALDEVPSDAEVNVDYLVGDIIIPRVGMDLPILEGMSNQNLWVGAGTMKPYQKMGRGNYSIAGHHMWDDGLLFAPLHRVEIGDTVYITDRSVVYAYEIDRADVLENTEGWVVSDEQGDGILTLVTCNDFDTTERLILQGTLVDVLEGVEAAEILNK